MPSIPINEPQMERDKRMMAGFSPVIFPMILGTRKVSCMICTIAKTANAHAMIIQKFCPVSAALRIANKMVGRKPMICK